MKVLFNGDTIKDMLTQVSTTATEKHGITLSFSEQGDMGTVMQVTAYNGTNMQVSTYVPCTSEGVFETTTKYVGIGFLNSLGGLLAFDKNIRMEITATEVILSLEDHTSIVKTPLKEEGVSVDYDVNAASICAVKVNNQKFIKAMKKYGFAASNTAPGCDGIFLKKVDDGLQLSSVDGCAGACGCIECEELVPLQPGEGNPNGFLFPQKLSAICNSFTQETTQIFFLKPYALLVNGMTFVMISRPAAAFPEAMITFVMQNKNIACEAIVERAAIANVLSLLKNTEKDISASVTFSIEGDKLRVSNSTEETTSYIEIKKNGELEGTVHVSMHYLDKICSILPNKAAIRFQHKIDGKPLSILFSLEENYEAFVLPVVIPSKEQGDESEE